MRVVMYSPEGMYGFAGIGSEKVFFHLETFIARVGSSELAPPPIIGEEVQVSYDPETGDGERAPRASFVERVHVPVEVHGIVESFNAERGWGWAKSDAFPESFYLHRSEVENGRLPVPGQEVVFYKGHKNGRLRACHVRVGALRG